MEHEYIHGSSRDEQKRLNILNQITNNSFIEYLGIMEDAKICDFGCGTGNLISDITNKYPSIKITGVEISEEQYLEARNLNENNSNVTLINSDILESSLPNNYFDISYCRYFLEHVHDPVIAIREMIRVTKPGGKIIAQENDLNNVLYYPDIKSHDDLMRSFCNLQVEMGGDPFIGRKLFSLFKEAGLSDIKIHYEPEIYTENNPDNYKAWMTNSMRIFLGAREALLSIAEVNENEFNSVCDQFRTRIEKPNGVALFHWNRVKAKK